MAVSASDWSIAVSPFVDSGTGDAFNLGPDSKKYFEYRSQCPFCSGNIRDLVCRSGYFRPGESGEICDRCVEAAGRRFLRHCTFPSVSGDLLDRSWMCSFGGNCLDQKQKVMGCIWN